MTTKVQCPPRPDKVNVRYPSDRALSPYDFSSQRDEELEMILERAGGDPVRALDGWLAKVRSRLPRPYGDYHVPECIAKMNRLPDNRQVYIDDDGVFKVEENGDVDSVSLL